MSASLTVSGYSQAVALLHQCRDLRRPTDASRYLERVGLHYRLLSLYQHFFPERWDGSSACSTPAADPGYSPQGWEFLELVNQHLFPLPYLEYLEEGFELDPWQILVTPVGMGWLDNPWSIPLKNLTGAGRRC